MSIEEKRGLVYELAKRPNAAFEMLQSWSRQEILQILCSELGKERKYTGLTKLKIIENLLKVVADKNSVENHNNNNNDGSVTTDEQQPESKIVPTSKRHKKSSSERPNAAGNPPSLVKDECVHETSVLCCKNSACRAGLSPRDKFCKRCSCCLCHKFDDNKDPSLWLTCGSEDGDGCNLSCHLECALKDETSGLGGNNGQVDGCFCCTSCRKMNDMLRCWRKQLATAMEARRVDILCYRVSLSQKLLSGSVKYEAISKIVEKAADKLKGEVGTLSGTGGAKMGRGIVNRMSCGQQVQKLCAAAVDALDNILSEMATHQDQAASQDAKDQAVNSSNNTTIRFEDIGATCATLVLDPPSHNPTTGDDMRTTVCYSVWHREAHDGNETYIFWDATCTLSPPQTRFFVSGLSPLTEYIFKVICLDGPRELSTWETRLTTNDNSSSSSSKDVDVKVEVPVVDPERSQSPVTNCSTLSNPSSVEDDINNITCTSTINTKAVQVVDHCNKAEKKADAINSEGNQVGAGETNCQQTCTEHGRSIIEQSGALNNNLLSDEVPIGGEAKCPTGMEVVPYVVRQELPIPLTPCRLDKIIDTHEGNRGGQINKSRKKATEESRSEEEELHPRRRSSKKRRVVENGEECAGGSEPVPSSSNVENDLEHYVKVMRWLECKGHIEKSFRQKFLTWYSLRATPQEARVVKAFVTVLSDDPASLAEQLVDAFGEMIAASTNGRRELTAQVPSGFCMKLWH